MCCPRTVAAKRQSAAVCSAQAQLSENVSDSLLLKEALLDSFWGTERGLTAAPETRAEINEVISQLEAVNPNSSPTAEQMFGGRWRLVYTSNSELVQVLLLTKLPFVQALELHQSIDCDTSTVENAVEIALPGSSVSIRSLAAFKIESPKRIGIHLDQTASGTATVQVTAHVDKLHTDPTVAAVRSAIKPVLDTSSAVVDFVAGFLEQFGQPDTVSSKQPGIHMPVLSPLANTWLITSYLDEDLCIRRGDAGSVFVFVPETTQLQELGGAKKWDAKA